MIYDIEIDTDIDVDIDMDVDIDTEIDVDINIGTLAAQLPIPFTYIVGPWVVTSIIVTIQGP